MFRPPQQNKNDKLNNFIVLGSKCAFKDSIRTHFGHGTSNRKMFSKDPFGAPVTLKNRNPRQRMYFEVSAPQTDMSEEHRRREGTKFRRFWGSMHEKQTQNTCRTAFVEMNQSWRFWNWQKLITTPKIDPTPSNYKINYAPPLPIRVPNSSFQDSHIISRFATHQKIKQIIFVVGFECSWFIESIRTANPRIALWHLVGNGILRPFQGLPVSLWLTNVECSEGIHDTLIVRSRLYVPALQTVTAESVPYRPR